MKVSNFFQKITVNLIKLLKELNLNKEILKQVKVKKELLLIIVHRLVIKSRIIVRKNYKFKF